MSLVPSITQGQTNAVEPVKSHNHGPRRNTPVPLPFTVGSQPSHPVSSNATQRPRGYAHDINKQPVAAKRVASDSNSGLNLSLHQMDQSHLTPSYGVDSKLRAESGNRRKHCLENHTAQPPLAELPQNPDRTAPAAEAAFKVGQFTEHVTHAEPSGLTGDSKGNSSPGVTAAKADKTETGESQLVESTDRPTKRQRFCTGSEEPMGVSYHPAQYQPSWDKDPTLPTPSKVLQCLLPAVAENHTSAGVSKEEQAASGSNFSLSDQSKGSEPRLARRSAGMKMAKDSRFGDKKNEAALRGKADRHGQVDNKNADLVEKNKKRGRSYEASTRVKNVPTKQKARGSKTDEWMVDSVLAERIHEETGLKQYLARWRPTWVDEGDIDPGLVRDFKDKSVGPNATPI